MASKLNMQDLIDLLVAKNDVSKEEAESFIVELFNLIEKGLATDELTKIKDFGTFKLTHIQERESIDVNTQEKIVIPPHRRVTFVPAQLLKSLVNKPFAHFETTPLNEGVFMEGISHNGFADNTFEEDRYDGDEEKADNNVPIEEEAIAQKEPNITFNEKEENPIDDQKESDDFDIPLPLPSLDFTDTPESKIEEFTTLDSSIEDDTNKTINHKTSSGASKKPSVEITNTPKKPKRVFILWLNIAIVLLVIFSLSFAYNYYTSNNSSDLAVKVSETAKPLKDASVANTEIPLDEVEDVVDSVESAEALPRKTAKMSPGRTLRLIALDKLGDREFWIYIYMINKNKIENPNVLPIGLVLELPHENEFPMNASNPVDVANAKKLGDELIKNIGK